MQAALTQLGYKTYHGHFMFDSPRQLQLWNRALDAKFYSKGKGLSPSEWDEILGGYQAVTGSLTMCFLDDLMHLHPTAKVILTHRPFESWYTSMQATVFPFRSHPNLLFRIFLAILCLLDPIAGAITSMNQKVLFYYGGDVSKE